MVKRERFFAFILFLMAFVFSCRNAAAPAEDKSDAVQTPVTITHINGNPIAEYIELNATSAFLLKNYVKSNANGYLQSANVMPGQAVSRGQVLFSVKTKRLKASAMRLIYWIPLSNLQVRILSGRVREGILPS